MDTALKSTGVGSKGVGIVALAVSNCVVFAPSWRFQDANPGHLRLMCLGGYKGNSSRLPVASVEVLVSKPY
jgi:hypothetical protein